MANGDALMAAAKKKKRPGGNFIKAAIKHPGALHAQLGVPQGQTIPPEELAEAAAGKDGALAKKRAQFAQTLAGLRK